MVDQITCLHGLDGKVLYATSQGSSALLTDTQLKLLLCQFGVYRVMAVPENYRLITEVHSSLVGKTLKSQLLIGSPLLCRQRKRTAEQVLNCLSVLSVHDCLSNTWHSMDSNLYNNYLLLRAYAEEGVSDLVKNIYKHHCLKPVFDFMGLKGIEKAITLISLIVDPRWYINPDRPYRFSGFERHFGLLPKQFEQAWRGLLPVNSTDRFYRTYCLTGIVMEMDRHNFVLQDLETGPDGPNMMLKACRRVLAFVVRNWLTSLTRLPYFDPNVFFKQADARNAYLQLFRE